MDDQEDCVHFGDCNQPTMECDAFCKFYEQSEIKVDSPSQYVIVHLLDEY